MFLHRMRLIDGLPQGHWRASRRGGTEAGQGRGKVVCEEIQQQVGEAVAAGLKIEQLALYRFVFAGLL